MADGIIAAIEVGETTVRAMVARHRAGSVRLLAQAEVPSEGVKRGLVTDVAAASHAIRGAFRTAERQLGYPVYNAVLCVPGSSVYAMSGQAAVEPSGPRRSVTQHDTDRVMGRARPRLTEGRQKLLHLLPMRFSVDGVVYEDRPLRVRGRELTVSTCALVTDTAHIQGFADAVEAAGVHVTDFVATPLASSLSVLTEAEQRVGVLLLEIGTRSSTIALLQRGCFLYGANIPVGGFHLTNDLALGLSVPFDSAEQLKRKEGSLYLEGGAQVIPVAGEQGALVNVQRQEMIALIRDRVQELLALAVQRVQSAGWEHLPPGGIVLTGGSAHLHGLERMVRDLLHVPARTGTPRGLEALPLSVQDPAWAPPAGALVWKALCISGDRASLAVSANASSSPLTQRIAGWATRLFEVDPSQASTEEKAGSSSNGAEAAIRAAAPRGG